LQEIGNRERTNVNRKAGNELVVCKRQDRERIEPFELAFDVDGVVADTFRKFVETAESDYGLQIPYEEVTQYDFWNVIEIEWDVCEDIIARILHHPVEMGLRPMEGAVEVLTRLSRRAPLLFVTARTEKDGIYQWVLEHLPGVDPEAIRLEAVGTHEGKAAVLSENGARYFIEDRLDTCYLLQEAAITPIVFDQPWNRDPHPFHVVNSWVDISSMIDWSD
jgi:hypothetical protein